MDVIERGWAGHFICGDRCRFTRNTLINGDDDSVVVSTVGSMLVNDKMEPIGADGRYYETMVFGSHSDNGYIEADVSDQRLHDGEWSICADSPDKLPDNVDNVANDMHNAAVNEFVLKLSKEQK